MTLHRMTAWLLSSFLAICFQSSLALAGQWSYIAGSEQGTLYLAGTAPKLLEVQPTGKVFFRSEDKKYCQKFSVIYQRSNRDQGNRTFPVIKARRWEDVIDWIDSRKRYKDFPLYELFHFWNKSMPDTSHWKKPFPTLNALITYKIVNEVGLPGWSNRRINKGKPKKIKVMVEEWVWDSKWWVTGRYKKVPRQKWVSPPPQRKALGRDKVKEELIYALPPGKHKLEIRGHVDIDEKHPLVRFKKIYGWKKYAKSPIEILVDKIAGVLSVKNLLKGMAASFAQETVSTYTLHIPAITPTLKGMHKKEAYNRIKQWSLQPKFKMKNTSKKSLHEKVTSQSPAPGTLLPAGSTVEYTYWVYKSAPPIKQGSAVTAPPQKDREAIRSHVLALKKKCTEECGKIWKRCRDNNCSGRGYSGCSSDCGGCPGDPCGWVLNTDWFVIDSSYGGCAQGIISYAQNESNKCVNTFITDKRGGRILIYRKCMQDAWKAWTTRWNKQCREPACKKKCEQSGKKFKALVQGSCICQ